MYLSESGAMMFSELRYALKSLIKAPSFTLPAVLTLALGLGGAMTFYTAFHSVFLRTPSYPGANRIYRLVTTSKQFGTSIWPVIGHAQEMQRASSDVECIGALGLGRGIGYLTQNDGIAIPVQSLRLDEGIQRMSGLRYLLGSGFHEENFRSGKGVILSYRFWKNHFGAEPAILGRALKIDNASHIVQGVLAEHVEIPLSAEADVYTPSKTLSPEEAEGTTSIILLRLREGATPEMVLPQLRATARALASNPDRVYIPGLQSLRRATAEEADMRFFIVCGAAALFLLLATANVASLFLARAAEKTWETSMRLCLGTPDSALFRKFLFEGLVVALTSAALGFWLNMILADSMRAWIPGGDSLPGLNGTWDHLSVALFGFSLVILITLLLGLVPMLRIRRLNLSLALQEGQRTQSVRTKGRTTLVIVQMTLATLLLCAAGLLGRSLWDMTHRPTGIVTEKLAMVRLLYGQHDAWKPWNHSDFLFNLRRRPGIQAASVTFGLGGSRGMKMDWHGFDIKGAKIGENALLPEQLPYVKQASLSDQVFKTLGASLIQGRDFKPEDTQKHICIINRETERLAGLPIGKSVGQKIVSPEVDCEIIGVVSNFDLFQESQYAMPMLFEPTMWHAPDALFVRATLSRKDLEATITSVMHDICPGVKPGSLDVLSELQGEQSLPNRQIFWLLAVFGGTAILLAALGLSALLSDSISRRQRELGIRATLGAEPNFLIRQMLLQGLWRAGLGVGLGIAAALASGRYIESLLFGISANDPKTLALVASVLLLLGFISSLIPALRTASIDPARALREE
jgi:putative ABC transport system permease protein